MVPAQLLQDSIGKEINSSARGLRVVLKSAKVSTVVPYTTEDGSVLYKGSITITGILVSPPSDSGYIDKEVVSETYEFAHDPETGTEPTSSMGELNRRFKKYFELTSSGPVLKPSAIGKVETFSTFSVQIKGPGAVENHAEGEEEPLYTAEVLLKVVKPDPSIRLMNPKTQQVFALNEGVVFPLTVVLP